MPVQMCESGAITAHWNLRELLLETEWRALSSLGAPST